MTHVTDQARQATGSESDSRFSDRKNRKQTKKHGRRRRALLRAAAGAETSYLLSLRESRS
jgi:hypothetical protein